MLFDFAGVETPLSDSLVLDHSPGWKRIRWTPSEPRLGFTARPGTGAPRPKRDR